MLTRRFLMLAALVAPAFAAARPLAAQSAVLADVERYLNGIDTLAARFEQIAPDGSLSRGRVYIQRPGRLRFDYDPPSRIRLIAPGDWRLVFYDASIGQVNVIPISQTPLGILLDDEVRLDGDVEVTNVREQAGELAVTVIRKGEADQGSVTLVFAKSPLALRRWSVVDAQGLVTHIVLQDVETGGKLDSELFRWRDPQTYGLPD
ncbi:MAG: outer membrane lipoprotein carrier protein LolA [Geminicoccaceae bacterium]|nr:outer membrane lipoprotein carrier protein LolA [Geminicoccaceae bacterium]MCB9969080.1 outer membrane lipoprotein carrier protein LolA [Geminicoccaceae bacterium]